MLATPSLSARNCPWRLVVIRRALHPLPLEARDTVLEVANDTFHFVHVMKTRLDALEAGNGVFKLLELPTQSLELAIKAWQHFPYARKATAPTFKAFREFVRNA